MGREEGERRRCIYGVGLGHSSVAGRPRPLLGCRMSFARLDKTSLRLRYFSRRLGGVSSHASSSTTACPRCCFAPPAPPRGNSFLCPTSINNAFCDPLKLAKNIPPPAATRVVTQSPPIEFDSLFHSVSQSVVRSHLASEPIISYHSRPVRPPPLPPRRLVVSYPQAVGIFRAHVLTAWHFSIYGTAFGQV